MSSAIAKQIEKSTDNPGAEDSKITCDACSSGFLKLGSYVSPELLPNLNIECLLADGCKCVTVQRPDQDLRGCQCGSDCNCPHCPGQQAIVGQARKMEGDQTPSRIGG